VWVASLVQQLYLYGHCCVALSEASGPSSVSESHADSRAETTTSTTQGCAGSSSVDSTFPRNWKELSTQSEREYAQCKHKAGKLRCHNLQLVTGMPVFCHNLMFLYHL
jgi:hypothetical protein